MEYEIVGDSAFPELEVSLAADEQIVAEPGAMLRYSPGIEMTTDTGSGGLVDTAKRAALGGESVFVNTFTVQSPGSVTLVPPAPGDVSGRFLNQETIYAKSGAFLAAEPDVDIGTEFRGASSFFGGGDAFLLQLSGVGTVFLDSYGALGQIELDGDEQTVVDTDHVVAFDSSVQHSTSRAGGLTSRAFGNEGKTAEFTGPGTVWVQNRDFERLAENVIAEEGPGGDEATSVTDFL
ncbi:TIGR00266 family protein [Halovenus sp. WSH3]|uniref:TIGR00266 family protein n=1 Tax=Halovenus carboxidivorans TaxID=2692199 RepID=A0A6B0TAP8_9EURY|nr:TIGR00266 family protein [Halovenus carboxidivorans]MXR50249.1 TIGR00266 family protein [Halovenus carboxidivorans]